MQLTIDTENISAGDAAILAHVLGLLPDSPERVFTGTATQFLGPHDNPGQGAATGAHMTNGAGMGLPVPLGTNDANAAFGGAPLGGALYTAGAGQQPIAQGMGNLAANGMPMPVASSSTAGSVQGDHGQQAGAGHSTHAQSGTELDANNLPWDARIHSGSKEKNKDNTWRGKRNTPAATIQAVEAELRAAMSAGQGQQVQAVSHQYQPGQVNPAAQAAVADALRAAEAARQQQYQPAQAMQNVQQFQQQQGTVMDFPTLSMEVANLQSQGKLQMPELFDIVGMFQLSAFHLLQQRPDLVPMVWQQIQLRTAGR